MNAIKDRSQMKPAAEMADRYKPIVASQEELLELVTTFTGTKTGIVTPTIADWLLQFNTDNRPLADAGVERFRHILKNGLWINTGEPVIVSREGVLNDGQHRLTAIVDAGRFVELDVRFGIPREAFVQSGTAFRRTAADVLAIDGITQGRRVAAIAKGLWHYRHGSLVRHSQFVEPTELLRISKESPNIRAALEVLHHMKLAILRASWFGVVLAVILDQAPDADVASFAAQVDDPTGPEHDGARRLHQRLVADAISRAKLQLVDRIILAIKAWNAWVERRPVGTLKVSVFDRSKDGFPQIRTHPMRAGVRRVA